MFIDQATIYVKAGKGGNGVISFRREKFIPKGGPDGGNGGNGGSIIFRADAQLTTLMDFRYKRNYKAGDGEPGMGSNKTGKSAEDVVIRVPAGTIIKNADTEETIADLVDDDQEFLAARAGKGGKGNAEFATSTKQAPRFATPGTPGEEKHPTRIEIARRRRACRFSQCRKIDTHRAHFRRKTQNCRLSRSQP